MTDNEQILAEIKQQNIWLKKLNEKFALFLILLIIGWLIQLIF